MSSELSYYELYLLKYLREYHPDKNLEKDFIMQRVDDTTEVFEKARLEGYSVEGAQELAMEELLRGLHFSKYNMISKIVEKEFENDIPQNKVQDFITKVQPSLSPIFSKYPQTDDFEQTKEYDNLYNELVGEITLYLEEHGL